MAMYLIPIVHKTKLGLSPGNGLCLTLAELHGVRSALTTALLHLYDGENVHPIRCLIKGKPFIRYGMVHPQGHLVEYHPPSIKKGKRTDVLPRGAVGVKIHVKGVATHLKSQRLHCLLRVVEEDTLHNLTLYDLHISLESPEGPDEAAH